LGKKKSLGFSPHPPEKRVDEPSYALGDNTVLGHAYLMLDT